MDLNICMVHLISARLESNMCIIHKALTGHFTYKCIEARSPISFTHMSTSYWFLGPHRTLIPIKYIFFKSNQAAYFKQQGLNSTTHPNPDLNPNLNTSTSHDNERWERITVPHQPQHVLSSNIEILGY